MKHCLAFLPFLALSAVAQEDVLKSLAPGDRIQVTFRSGGTLIGTLVPPPVVGPAAEQRRKSRPVDVKPPAAPFSLLFFYRAADPSTATQEAILQTFLQAHPEGSLRKLAVEEKASADLVKLHKVVATPTLVFQESSSGLTQAYMGLQSGERLETGIGRLRAKVAEEKVDYATEAFLTVDVSLEYPGLNGTMSLARKDIKDVRKLQKLDDATRRRLEEEHRKIRDGQAADEAARRDAEKGRTDGALAEIDKAEKDAKEAELKADEVKALEEKAAKLKAGEELLKQFPPDQWNEERLKDIGARIQAQLIVTADEKEFLLKQAEWAEAIKNRQAKEKKSSEEGEKK